MPQSQRHNRKTVATTSPNEGIYYLGRVIKLGTLDDEAILSAVLNPSEVSANDNEWTIVESQRLRNRKGGEYVFGKLAKYKPAGKVNVIDKEKHQSVTQDEPNLTLATSPFVYLPEFSGIAHLYVANQIEHSIFAKRFAEIIESTRGKFFTTCAVEPVGDLEGFIAKVVRLDSISEISATVEPPNPLYGPLWEDLKNFLEKRNAASFTVDESAPPNAALNSHLVEHLASIQQRTSQVNKTADLTDAAVLMAIDGYGKGTVKGRRGRRTIVIKTSATVKNFTFDRDPEPQLLYDKAAEVFQTINDERGLEHQ